MATRRSRRARATAPCRTRYLDIHEDDDVDERRLVSWIDQASKLPGEQI